ncbi:MAG: BlaI/MecI/CopY family transcriptional regulator [Planctomycetia bacterium]|nr:BlaI/MecI/CopY family transcriptional regulator [Planctomycetia bacterium]
MAEPIPSGRELEILKVLWDLKSASVREVYERMCPDEELAFNTIQTLLRIMDDKGLVKHSVRGRTFVYSPAWSREQETVRFLDKVFDGALDQFVASLLRSRRATPQELAQLQSLIAGARSRTAAKSEERREKSDGERRTGTDSKRIGLRR